MTRVLPDAAVRERVTTGLQSGAVSQAAELLREEKRGVDILESKKLLPTNITIDQVLTQARVVAPIAANQQADRVQAIVNWQQIISTLYGREYAMAVSNVEKIGPALGRMAGVEEEFIGGPERIEQAKQIVMQMVAQQMAAEQAKAAPPPPDPHDIQQNLIHGGGALQ